LPSNPEMTIVIPTKDRPGLLCRALGSALAQTSPAIEVIVVDDASADPVRLDDSSDDRVRVVRHPVNRGLCAARNTGLAEARGTWITFLDDDDELVPEMVEVSLGLIRDSTLPPPVAALSGVAFVGGDGGRVLDSLIPRAVPQGEPIFKNQPGELYLPFASNLVVAVEVLRSIGGWDEGLRAWMEDDLLIRLNQVCSLEASPRITYRIHDHRGQRLHLDHDAMIAGWEQTRAKHAQVFAANPRLLARKMAMAGSVHMRAKRWRPSLQNYWRSWRLDPRRSNAVRQVVAGAIGPHIYSAYRRTRKRIGEARRERNTSSHVGSS
jgi:glycosyltransferase involved in cell wall biosynthesis